MASALGFVLLRDEDRLDRERAFRARGELAAAALQRAVEREVSRVEVGRAMLSGLADPIGELRRARARLVTGDQPLDRLDVIAPDRVPAGAAGREFGFAADTARIRATPPVELPTGGLGSYIVGPLYATRADPAGTLGSAAAIGVRRQQLTGYVVAVADPAALVRRAGLDDVGLDITLREAGELLYTAAEGQGDGAMVTAAVDVADKSWTAVFEPDGGLGSSGRRWLALVAGAVGLALLGAAVHSGDRAVAAARRRIQERDSELRLVSETGPLLQSTLDLSEMLPEFTVRLAVELDLDQVGIVVADDHGGITEVFAVGGRGSAPPDRLTDLGSPPERILPGQEVFLPLQRAGRTVGALRIRPRGGLDAARLRAVEAASVQLAAALGNAQLYAREQDAVRQLRELDELRTSFVSTVSHELRTTVTAIYGFADLLTDRWNDFSEEQRQSFLARVHRNAVTLQSMVDDLLAFSRLDRRGFTLRPEPVDLAGLTAEQLERMAPLLERHRLVTSLGEPVMALADHGAFERILANLVSNAAKFAPPDTTVTVAVDRVDGHGRLVVEDEGPGVAPEERDRVFTRFYRGSSPAAVSTRGTGVGLAVVRELTELHGGRVAMEESATGGARVVVLLPAAGEVDDGVTPASVGAGRRGGDA